MSKQNEVKSESSIGSNCGRSVLFLTSKTSSKMDTLQADGAIRRRIIDRCVVTLTANADLLESIAIKRDTETSRREAKKEPIGAHLESNVSR